MVGLVERCNGFFSFFSHLTQLPIHKDLMFIFGRIGVAGFFLMSGFLAVNSVSRRNWKQFALNRFLRIYPIFWLLVIAMYALVQPQFTIIELAANITLFNEFMGVENILGSSWMLSIMIVFFGVLMLCKRNIKKLIDIAFWLMCVGALILGSLRMATGLPFPTAFCLLQLVGLIGWSVKTGKEKIGTRIVIFEIILLVASYMSYSNAVVNYMIAYNIGILMFWAFKKWNISIKAFDKLGELGFTFFLGAGIPMLILSKFVSFSSMNVYAEVVLEFVLALCLAWIITKYIEKPLLSKGKEWEKKLTD